MAVTRSTGALIGTDESTGVALAAGDTVIGAEVDLLGDNTSVGDFHLYLVATPESAKLQVRVRINRRRVTGQAYKDVDIVTVNKTGSGTQKLYLGMFGASRYVSADVENEDSTYSSNLTNVALLYELEKVS